MLESDEFILWDGLFGLAPGLIGRGSSRFS